MKIITLFEIKNNEQTVSVSWKKAIFENSKQNIKKHAMRGLWALDNMAHNIKHESAATKISGKHSCKNAIRQRHNDNNVMKQFNIGAINHINHSAEFPW